ncbi:MAG: hypothetical protein JSW49_07485 [candidate division WOR-3 bacterium]|nr:MAG: hypothetical protein JSW49_07485 [candidate division WOR-3 bacterium]
MKKRYAFDNFIVHDGNRVAFTAAKKIVDFPGEVFNPFYIYGADGSGKTHLLTALSSALSEKSKADFMTAQEFEKDLGKRKKYDSPLIVDDIHEISEGRKRKLREIVEDALSNNVQLCFSSLVAPQKVRGFSQKLSSMMDSGLVCEMAAPTEAARIEMIRKKADEAGIILADETLEELARIAFGSVGEIESMINRLVTYSSLGRLEIDANSIALLLREFYPGKAVPRTPSLLKECQKDDIYSLEDVESPDLRKEYERRIAVWETKGFDVSTLKRDLSVDSLELRRIYHEYVERAKRMIELQHLFAHVDRERAPGEGLKIDSMIFNPAMVDDVESLLKAFDECREKGREYRRFNEFIIGFCNKLVWDTYHDKVLDNLGANNPFIIFGSKGTGKSHFLEAVCDDLISRNKSVLFGDLACPADTDFTAAVDKYDVVIIDNLDAILNATESVINDIGELIDAFREASKQVIIASRSMSDEMSLPVALEGIFDDGIVAVLEKPSADVVNEYMKQRMPADATGGIEQGFPEFDSFYDIAYYLRSISDDSSAVVPLGLPGEDDMAQPGAMGERIVFPTKVDEKGRPSMRIEITIGGNFIMPEVAGELIEEQY